MYFSIYIPYAGWLGANIYMGIQLMKKFGKGAEWVWFRIIHPIDS